MTTVDTPPRAYPPSKAGQPVWELAERLYPTQGNWTEEEFFALENHLIEFVDGRLEFLPMPTELHQDILLFLRDALRAFVQAGKASISGIKVQIKGGKYREPDVVFMLSEHASRRSNRNWVGANIAMEVVSPGKENREHDYDTKRAEYEEAGIPEYWIVDPEQSLITVLTLSESKTYTVHGEFKRGEQASSVLLKGFSVDVTEALKGAQA